MRRDARAFLSDVVGECARIRRFTAGLTEDDYVEREMTRTAVERAFITMGEALVCLSRFVPELEAEIPTVRRVIGFRNILVHNYTNHIELDDRRVWGIVVDHVPVLQSQAEAWLALLESVPS